VLGSFLTGVTVVTTRNEKGDPIGFTANSFTSVSLDPPLILVCLSKSSYLLPMFKMCKNFAVNILSEDQRDISTLFSSPIENRFTNIETHSCATNTPLINDVTAWLDCETYDVIDAGDHIILMGRVLEFDHEPYAPLGYLRGNYINVSLEQEVTIALENPSIDTQVGCIIEDDGKLLLLDKDEGVQLPTAAILGNEDDPNSLCGLLADLGVPTQENYLFAVFETRSENIMHIYYRAQVETIIPIELSNRGKFVAFDQIPFDMLPDDATRNMLERYIKERALDAFGIYIGEQEKGSIERIK
jgi:flavin reductase (DIM6/NTAB) family NADH-FMN oxidoreductase RutF